MNHPTLKFNLSGHMAVGYEVAPLVGVEWSHDTTALESEVREVVLALPHRDRLLRGEPAQVILPSWSPAAALILAEWHGQFGSWPIVQWAVPGAHGFEYRSTSVCDLNRIRQTARLRRN